jgi:hypothetical protein
MMLEFTIPENVDWKQVGWGALWGYIAFSYLWVAKINRSELNEEFTKKGKSIPGDKIPGRFMMWLFSPLLVSLCIFLCTAKWIVAGRRKVDWSDDANSTSRSETEDYRM